MGCTLIIDGTVRQLSADGTELSVTPFGVQYNGSLADDNEANLANLLYTEAILTGCLKVARALAASKAGLTGANPLLIGAIAEGLDALTIIPAKDKPGK